MVSMDSGMVSADSGQGERPSERGVGQTRIFRTGGSFGGRTTGDEATERDLEIEPGGWSAAAGGGGGAGDRDGDRLGVPRTGPGGRVGWPIPAELEDDDMIEARVFGPKRQGESDRGTQDVAFIHEELRRPG